MDPKGQAASRPAAPTASGSTAAAAAAAGAAPAGGAPGQQPTEEAIQAEMARIRAAQSLGERAAQDAAGK
eukprot:8860661-Pyramimonas_sp.AAC.1